MPCVHEFGIIQQLDPHVSYEEYCPDRYSCIRVEDGLLETLPMHTLYTMKSYFHTLDRPAYGLAWYGVTLIPPESCGMFYEAVTAAPDFPQENQLQDLAALLRRAALEKRFVIHYGV